MWRPRRACSTPSCLTNEQGLIGGAPASGNEAGASRNYAAMIDQPYQFDFYDGGGLDLAFLSFAEVDREGNVNVSRFGGRIIGPGGFINISQNAKTVVFSGTLRRPSARRRSGRSSSRRSSRSPSAAATRRSAGSACSTSPERAVFRLSERGVELVEIAPGLDLERDVLGRMGFRPAIAAKLTTMDARLFRPEPMTLARDLAARPARAGSPRLALLDAFSAAAE